MKLDPEERVLAEKRELENQTGYKETPTPGVRKSTSNDILFTDEEARLSDSGP